MSHQVLPINKEAFSRSEVCHHAAKTNSHILTESRKGESTMLTISRFAAQNASEEEVNRLIVKGVSW